jgi:hypothetical protein
MKKKNTGALTLQKATLQNLQPRIQQVIKGGKSFPNDCVTNDCSFPNDCVTNDCSYPNDCASASCTKVFPSCPNDCITAFCC